MQFFTTQCVARPPVMWSPPPSWFVLLLQFRMKQLLTLPELTTWMAPPTELQA